MKHVIPFLAFCALVSQSSLSAQTAAASSPADNSLWVAQGNHAGQPETISESGNNKNVQQNQDPLDGSRGNRIGRFGADYGYGYYNLSSRYPGPAEKPIVVHSSDMNGKDEANLEEDLAVMSHLLDKALEDIPTGPAHTRSAMGIDLFVTPKTGARSMYLEGYGALFLLSVGFPLVAPPSAAPEEKPAGDSAWEEARQELYGQSVEARTLTIPGEEFNEEKVNRLKDTLLRALKNATNIRGLEGNVTIFVLGGANSSSTTRLWTLDGAPGGSAAELLTSSGAAPAHRTVLTIKVTKTEVDAFAKGELKFADFRQRAKIASYTTAASEPSGVGVARFGHPPLKR